MTTLYVTLDNLKPNVRYGFKLNSAPQNRYEGTFDKVILRDQPIYIFSNVISRNLAGKIVDQSIRHIFGNPDNYPRDIFVYTSSLPGDLNRYINTFGGKSKKYRKSRRMYKKQRRMYKKSRRMYKKQRRH